MKAHHLIREHHTAQVLALVRVVFVKVLVVSTSSTSTLRTRSLLLVIFAKAHGKCGLAADTMCKSKPRHLFVARVLTKSRPLDGNPFNFWGKVIDCGDIPVTS